jgi:hypothetical protein
MKRRASARTNAQDATIVLVIGVQPCLHCLIGDVIDDFYAEHGSLSGEQKTIDVVEVITALAKTAAEMTFGADASLRKRILDHLMRAISQYEAEFANAPSSEMRH